MRVDVDQPLRSARAPRLLDEDFVPDEQHGWHPLKACASSGSEPEGRATRRAPPDQPPGFDPEGCKAAKIFRKPLGTGRGGL